MTGTFSLVGVADTSEAHEEAWNRWVASLRILGLEPEVDPVSFTDDTVEYPLRRISPASDFLSGEKAKVSA